LFSVEEVLREEIEVIDAEDCGDINDCIRLCYERKVLRVRPEILEKIKGVSRDCVIIVSID